MLGKFKIRRKGIMDNLIPYTRKAPDIGTIKIEGDTAAMELIRSQLAAALPNSTVTVSYGRSIVVQPPVGDAWSVNRGQYLARDTNGKFFAIDAFLLDAFYDPAP